MNTTMRLLIGGMAILLGACQSGGSSEMKEVIAQESDGVRIAVLSESGDLVQGQNRFRIAFSRNEQPVDAGVVSVASSMAMPGMAPMVAPIELERADETGQYNLTGQFAMSGAWQFEVRWDGSAGQGSTSFRVNVR